MSVCFTAIAVGIIEMLIPKESFKPQMRLITGAVLIISMLVPMYSISKLEIPDIDSQTISVDVNDSLASAAAASIKQEISSDLADNGINTAKIIVYTDIGKDNSIIINKAEILVGKNDIDKASTAAKVSEQRLQVNVEVGVSE